tara:strand:+ start:189 stop:707 length:519 start_codon:yes stop_codon:yes gene_type:complete
MEFINYIPQRIFIKSDNSCLFNAVASVCEPENFHDNIQQELRNLVANIIIANPEKYTTDFLEGRSPGDYTAFILDKNSWGGAIELDLLAHYYETEIGSFEIKTKRLDLFGGDCNYKKRAYVIYDGTHYDALALSKHENDKFSNYIVNFSTENKENLQIINMKFESMIDSYLI